MRLSKALEEKLLDKRLRDKLLAEGKVTQAQVDEYLGSMPDDSENATFTDKRTEH